MISHSTGGTVVWRRVEVDESDGPVVSEGEVLIRFWLNDVHNGGIGWRSLPVVPGGGEDWEEEEGEAVKCRRF